MNHILEKLTNVACDALIEEDEHLRNQFGRNGGAYPGKKEGILFLNFEKHFQFLIARKLIADGQFSVELEKFYHDMVLTFLEPNYSVVVEMKRWMSSNGMPELPKIEKDISKLKSSRIPGNKILMIFSVNPIGTTRKNHEFLMEKLSLDASKSPFRSFSTYNSKSELVEFWVSCADIR